jgi:glyoxylase-like metal-dependent hydrolase (beta-lactamase superfamily II)
MRASENFILKQMEAGPMQNFQYFAGDARTKEVALIDPAWDAEHLYSEAQKNDCKIVCILLTHGHYDHANAVTEILSKHNIPAYISKHEPTFYKPKHKNIVEIENGEIIKAGEIAFECILTPGHTPGSTCYRHNDALLTGDTLFIDGCGRCDLPGGNAREMYNSLYNIIMKLPDSTVIYSGHDYGPTPFATLGRQKKTNPYLTCTGPQEFLQQRMGLSF